jgi:hypothetical protein
MSTSTATFGSLSRCDSFEWDKRSTNAPALLAPASAPASDFERTEKQKMTRSTLGGTRSEKHALNHSFLDKSATSCFTRPATYRTPQELTETTTIEGPECQLTQAMLLATKTSKMAKVKKENLFVGVKLFNMLEINASLMYFRCRLKVLTNWEIHTDESNEEFMELLAAARLHNGGYADEALLLSTFQMNLLKAFHKVPDVTLGSNVESQSNETITVLYKSRAGSHFGLHSYETVCTLYELMELNDFPFDMQNLSVTFALEGATKKRYRLYVHQLDIKCSHNGTNIAEDWEVCAISCLMFMYTALHTVFGALFPQTHLSPLSLLHTLSWCSRRCVSQ